MGKNTLKKIVVAALASGIITYFGHKAEAFDAADTVAAWRVGGKKTKSADESRILDNYHRATCTGSYQRKFGKHKCRPAKLTIDEQVEILQFGLSRKFLRNATFELLEAIAGDYTPEQKKKLEQLVRSKENEISERNFCIADKSEVEQVEYIGSQRLTPMASIFATSEKYLDHVKGVAEQHKIPYQALVGIMVLENGGGTNKVSSSGCVGLFQFARGTEKAMKKYANRGLGFQKYNTKVDQRRNPYISAELAGWYLDYNYKLFGRLDFAVQAYHDGEGYLGNRVKQHIKNRFGYSAAKKDSLSGLIKKYDIKLVDVLTDKNIRFAKEAHNYFSSTIFMFDSFANKIRTMNYMSTNCGRRHHKYGRR